MPVPRLSTWSSLISPSVCTPGHPNVDKMHGKPTQQQLERRVEQPGKWGITHIILNVILGKLRRIATGGHDCRYGVLIQILHEDSLAERRLVMLTRAPVSVPTGADLVEEGAVHL